MQVLFLCCPMVALFIIILSLSEKVKAFRNSSANFERLSSDSLLKICLNIILSLRQYGQVRDIIIKI